MKNWTYILYIGLLGCFTMACQPSLEEEVQLPPGKVQISFTLALDELNSRSRAEGDWNEVETTTGVIGNSYENQIDLQNGLQVLVYTENGNQFIGKVINPDVIRQQTENGRIYEFQGDLEIDANYINQSQLSCRLMVFANCATVADHNKENLTFSHDAAFIPMWGVQTCTLTLTKGEVSRVPQTIYMLRAMAKVDVRMSDAIKSEHKLTSVTLDKYNSFGYVLPSGYVSASHTESLLQQNVFRPLSGAGEGSLSFVGSDGVFHIYIPEYQNVGENVTPATMKLVVNGKEYALEFKDYVTDAPFNIVRNHYYQYTITAVNSIENILVADLSYQSIPWTDVDNGELKFN